MNGLKIGCGIQDDWIKKAGALTLFVMMLCAISNAGNAGAAIVSTVAGTGEGGILR